MINEKQKKNGNIMNAGLTDAVFDWDGLLYRLMGDEDLAKEIVNDFLKDIPIKFKALKEALNKKESLLVKNVAHIIKGASGNIGAVALQKIAEQIEIAGDAKDLVKAGSFVAALDAQLEILKKTLNQRKN
jgi:HPt (histidine-containing phosphotransfer) domain-containing protein